MRLRFEGVLSDIFGDGFQWRWRVATSPWTSSLYTTETASILRSAFPLFLIITWRACRIPPFLSFLIVVSFRCRDVPAPIPCRAPPLPEGILCGLCRSAPIPRPDHF